MSDRYNSDDIAKEVVAGNTDKVRSEINSDALNMSPSEFRRVIENMQSTVSANKDTSHHVSIEKDGDGNVSAINISNEVLGMNYWTSKVFDKADLQRTDIAAVWGRLTRVLPGALDTGKKE